MQFTTAILALIPTFALAADITPFSSGGCVNQIGNTITSTEAQGCINIDLSAARSVNVAGPDTSVQFFSGVDCNWRTFITGENAGCAEVGSGFRSYFVESFDGGNDGDDNDDSDNDD